MSKTLSIYSPRHVLQLYMVPRFKLQLLFPGEIIKVATTYKFIICERRGANAYKRPALQTIQSKRRRATKQGCGNSGLHLGPLSLSTNQRREPAKRTKDGRTIGTIARPEIERNPALHRKRPILGPTIFGGVSALGFSGLNHIRSFVPAARV